MFSGKAGTAARPEEVKRGAVARQYAHRIPFIRPRGDGIALRNAIQDVYREREVTVA